jgi:hypothetical protein
MFRLLILFQSSGEQNTPGNLFSWVLWHSYSRTRGRGICLHENGNRTNFRNVVILINSNVR